MGIRLVREMGASVLCAHSTLRMHPNFSNREAVQRESTNSHASGDRGNGRVEESRAEQQEALGFPGQPLGNQWVPFSFASTPIPETM